MSEPDEPRGEVRIAEFRDAEIKDFNFRGLASVFNTPWSDELTAAHGYIESIAKGAFRKALAAGFNVPLLGAHRRHDLLASTQGSTLKLGEENRGLLVEADLPRNYLGEYYREMIERGDVAGMSYGMETRPEDSIITKKNGIMHRSIANVRRLLDVTLTWEPAYPATVAELRSMGFAALPLQALVSGEEEQTDDDAVTGSPSSTAPPPLKRLTDWQVKQMAEGGWVE